jgi:hypothetical protein
MLYAPGAVLTMHKNPSQRVQPNPKIHCSFVPYAFITSLSKINSESCVVRLLLSALPSRLDLCTDLLSVLTLFSELLPFRVELSKIARAYLLRGMTRIKSSCDSCARLAYQSDVERLVASIWVLFPMILYPK